MTCEPSRREWAGVDGVNVVSCVCFVMLSDEVIGVVSSSDFDTVIESVLSVGTIGPFIGMLRVSSGDAALVGIPADSETS